MRTRNFLNFRNICLSYIDFGGHGLPLLALHGHFGCASMFSSLADAIQPRWRTIALDQRGHGWSDKPGDYSREVYINDIVQVIHFLNLAPVVILGHSLGGVNAYQVAARYPELVKALIIEDIGAVTNQFQIFNPDWPIRFNTVREVLEVLKANGFENDPYFLESLIEYPDGWGFQFRYEHMIDSQRQLQGDWTEDWRASKCPLLLLHGHKSWVLNTEHAREITIVRPNTRLIEFPNSGHTIHDDEPEIFNQTVKLFLGEI